MSIMIALEGWKHFHFSYLLLQPRESFDPLLTFYEAGRYCWNWILDILDIGFNLIILSNLNLRYCTGSCCRERRSCGLWHQPVHEQWWEICFPILFFPFPLIMFMWNYMSTKWQRSSSWKQGRARWWSPAQTFGLSPTATSRLASASTRTCFESNVLIIIIIINNIIKLFRFFTSLAWRRCFDSTLTSWSRFVWRTSHLM